MGWVFNLSDGFCFWTFCCLWNSYKVISMIDRLCVISRNCFPRLMMFNAIALYEIMNRKNHTNIIIDSRKVVVVIVVCLLAVIANSGSDLFNMYSIFFANFVKKISFCSSKSSFSVVRLLYKKKLHRQITDSGCF